MTESVSERADRLVRRGKRIETLRKRGGRPLIALMPDQWGQLLTLLDSSIASDASEAWVGTMMTIRDQIEEQLWSSI